ncbi:tail assembly chaperone [Haloarcula virus HCTV-16]|nr:tail assembly chaperone [Haloarcula virus HCTV-16]
MQQTTIDLREEARKIREEKLPSVEDAQDELVAQIEEEYESYNDVPESEDQAFEKLEEKRIELEGQAESLERVVEEWDGGEFIVRELTTGALAEIQDSVSEKSFEFDPERGEMKGGTPKQGFGMVETLRKSIVRQPPGAPTRENEFGEEVPEPANYPHKIGLFIFEQVNSFNTVGETDLGKLLTPGADEQLDLLVADMVFRGLNPDKLPARFALAYQEYRDTVMEQRKKLWQEAAAELFGEGG